MTVHDDPRAAGQRPGARAPDGTTRATGSGPAQGIRVRTTARRNHFLRRVWDRTRAVVGGVLLTGAALLGWLTILIPFYLAMDVSGGDDDLTQDERAAFVAVGQLLMLVVMASLGAWLAGRQLVRTRRDTVLWLRRFQYRNAIRVVGAALDHIGRTWRVVTLDDLDTTPVGLSLGLRLPSRLLTLVRRGVPRAVRVAFAAGQVVTKVCVAGIVGLVVWTLYHGEVLLLLDSVPGGSGPRPDWLEGELLRVFIVVLVGQFVLLLAYVLLQLALLPLFGAVMLLTGVHDQMTATESSKLRTVQLRDDISKVVSSLEASSHRALAPRLTVLRVDGALWQETVSALARSCRAVILDVSQVTENLLWEVEEVTRRLRTRIVLVGHADCIADLTRGSDAAGPAASGGAARLRALLDGQEVLAYTTDLRGRLRFQRALFAELETTRARAPVDLTVVLRTLTVLLGITCVAMAVQRATWVVSAWL